MQKVKTLVCTVRWKAYYRSVAQSGSAPALGAGGPKFESLYSDQKSRFPLEGINLFLDKGLANNQLKDKLC